VVAFFSATPDACDQLIAAAGAARDRALQAKRGQQ
jgi:hypothetical protein